MASNNRRINSMSTDENSITCKDILAKYYNTHLRIGFRDGTGFIWCNLCSPYSIDEIRHEQNVLRDQLKISYDNAVSSLETLKKGGYATFAYKMQKAYLHIKEDQIKRRWKLALSRGAKAIKNAKAKLDIASKDDDFILNSKVITTYLSEDPEEYPGTTIILLDGNFMGKYWNESEYLGIPYKTNKIQSNEASLNLACAVLESAVNSSDKKFFYSDVFGVYMPNYDGPDIWHQLKKKGLVHEKKGFY